MRRRRSISFRATGAVVFAAVAVACASPAPLPPTAASPLLGGPIPRVDAPAPVTGPRIDASALAGKAVVVEFFAEYCAPCKRLLPAVERFSREYPGVTFIGVSEDEYAATARELSQRYALTFTVVHDESGAFRGRFRVSALPITFVADRAGVIRWVSGRGDTEADLPRVLDALR